MEVVLWSILFSVDYSALSTVASLRPELDMLARRWKGWAPFPWWLTVGIHRLVDTHPVCFDLLVTQMAIASYAAHLLLTAKVADRREMFSMMLREKFQFVGVFRLLLIEALRAEMKFTKLPYIRDCRDGADGNPRVSADELVERRRAFQECWESAGLELLRLMNMATFSESMDEWFSGHRLSTWARCADMPELAELKVRASTNDGIQTLTPCKCEATLLCQAGRTVPVVEIEGAHSSVASGPSSPPAVGTAGNGHCRFRPLHDDWGTVELDGKPISLRSREKLKDFLRTLWTQEATRRSKAIIMGPAFPKPSSLFVAGGHFVRSDEGPTGRDVPVKSALGAMISCIYRDVVGRVPADKKGNGGARFYLRIYADSDST